MRCFLAMDGSRVAGRIASILDHNQFAADGIGFFGFFESSDSQPVADALVRAAWGWLRARGAKRMRGPVSPSTNYECGLLIEGFDSSPFVMMTYNPRYYPSLLEQAGLRKTKDLFAYITTAEATAGHKAMRVADRAMKSNRV